MKTISYKSNEMQSKVINCEIANGELHTAYNLLKDVQSHDDWNCSERKTIVNKMESCKSNISKITNDHDSLLGVLKTLDASWADAENQVISMFKSVDASAKDALKVPANAEYYRGNYLIKSLFRYGLIPGFITSTVVAQLGLVPFNAYIWPFRTGLNVSAPAPTTNQNNSQTNSAEQGATNEQSNPSHDVSQTTNSGSAKGNAENLGMHYYTQGKGYNKAWDAENFRSSEGNDFSRKASVSCGICCDAMLMSYLGVDKKPGDLLQANYDAKCYGSDGKLPSADFNAKGIKNTLAENNLNYNELGNGQGSLDKALANWQADPNNVSPPMICITNYPKMSTHYVIVTGKNPDGSYNIINPSEDGKTTFNVTAKGSETSTSTSYGSPVRQVVQYSKK